jgi:hypothetical protein
MLARKSASGKSVPQNAAGKLNPVGHFVAEVNDFTFLLFGEAMQKSFWSKVNASTAAFPRRKLSSASSRRSRGTEGHLRIGPAGDLQRRLF